MTNISFLYLDPPNEDYKKSRLFRTPMVFFFFSLSDYSESHERQIELNCLYAWVCEDRELEQQLRKRRSTFG